MKKYLVGLFAIALAIGFSAFTNQHNVIKHKGKFSADAEWYQYKGSGDQSVVSNYFAPELSAPEPCEDASTLCFIRVDDRDSDNDVDAADFAASFAAIDTNHDGAITSSDGTEDHDLFELKN